MCGTAQLDTRASRPQDLGTQNLKAEPQRPRLSRVMTFFPRGRGRARLSMCPHACLCLCVRASRCKLGRCAGMKVASHQSRPARSGFYDKLPFCEHVGECVNGGGFGGVMVFPGRKRERRGHRGTAGGCTATRYVQARSAMSGHTYYCENTRAQAQNGLGLDSD